MILQNTNGPVGRRVAGLTGEFPTTIGSFRTIRSVICLFLLTPPLSAQEPSFDRTIKPFLKAHCIDCHQGDDAEADVRLDRIDGSLATGKDAEVWARVFDQLAAGEMPPKDEPRPDRNQTKVVRMWIGRNLELASSLLARQRPSSTIRRLNRIEYSNTIRDLFGIKFEAGRGFPQDDSAHGFDNVDEALTLSPLLLEKYLREAERITERVILTEKPKTIRGGPWTGNELVYHKTEQIRDGDKLKFFMVGYSNGGGAFDPFHIAFNSHHRYTTSAPGRYRVRVKAHPEGPLVGPSARWRIVYHDKDFETHPEGCESPRLLFVVGGEFAGRVNLDDRQPRVYEFTTWAEAGLKFGFTFENGAGGVRGGKYKDYQGPAAVIHWIEIEGPLVEQWPTKAQRSIFFGGEDAEPTRDYARDILARFARRAYRRPLSEDEIDELLRLFDTELAAGSSFEVSIAVAIERALCSPHFLYLDENLQSDPSAYKLASRLSYFLWSSMPDEELFRAAEDGSLLNDPEPQVRRMLEDPKAKSFVHNFAGQWLNLRHVQDIAVDRTLYPDFNDYLRTLFVRETELFFHEILDNDLSVLNFIDSDFAMLNNRLAYHYGIKGVTGSEFRRVRLDPQSHRGGLMTQGSVLLLTTCGTRTSPILRGVWMMENLLGMPVPPPPKDVPELPAAPRGRISQRERLEAHRSIKACARCHDRIDPLGFPLEHFDVIGRWREDYSIDTRYGRQHGPPVDAKTEWTSGDRIDGPDELRKLLLVQRKELFCRGLVKNLLTYALSRGLTLADHQTVERLVRSMETNDYCMSDLIVEIVESDAFRKR